MRNYDGKISMVYRFIDKKMLGEEYVVYVGRSDKVDSRINSHLRALNTFGRHKKAGRVTKVEFCFIDGGRRDIVSYYEESLQYHLSGGKDSLRGNERHPEQPHFRNRKFKCPICEGVGSDSYEHFEVNSESYHREW